MQLIGLSGYARSGKDTVADILVEECGFTKVSFADPMRRALEVLDPHVWTRGRFGAGYDPLSEVLSHFGGWEGAKDASPDIRPLMQRFGTEVGRKMWGEDFWVDRLMESLDPAGSYVIADCRFPNEAEAVQRNGGIVARINRPGVGPANTHPSETALDDFDFDLYISNEGSLPWLRGMIAGHFGPATSAA